MMGRLLYLPVRLHVLLVLLAYAPVSKSACEDERQKWADKLKNGMNMGVYIADPALFFISLWKYSARLATCMNKDFESGPLAPVHAVSVIPGFEGQKNVHNYSEWSPPPINDTWSEYGATVTGLHADKRVRHEHSTLLAQIDTESLNGLCCLQDFSFVLKAPRSVKGTYNDGERIKRGNADEDPRPIVVVKGQSYQYKSTRHSSGAHAWFMEEGETRYYCRKGNVVRNFATSSYAVPLVEMGLYSKKFANGDQVELPDYSKGLDYKALWADNTITFTDEEDLIKDSVLFMGESINSGSATNLTLELFKRKVNQNTERVAACSIDNSTSMYYGVMAIEPEGRGKPGNLEPVPIPIYQNSMLHMDGSDRMIFARVSSPRAFLMGIRFSCSGSEVKMEDFEQCNMPEIWPLKEVTQVSGNDIRPYKLKEHLSVKGYPISFHREKDYDFELIILFSLLGSLGWSFGLVIKCKNRLISIDAARQLLEEHDRIAA